MPPHELEYVGRTLRELQNFPEEVQDIVALALLEAQIGQKHQDAKPLADFGGARVLEIALSYQTDAYRVMYTTRFPGVVYVLHAFKKKSKRGSQTPKRDMELVQSRLKDAEALHQKRNSR